MKIVIDPNNRKFQRLPVDGELAGCVILKHMNEESSGAEQIYRVKYDCCGTVVRMSHKDLIQRHSKGSKMCSDCGARVASRGQRNHPASLRAKAMALRAQGLSCRKIEEEIGVSRWTIREWTKKTRTIPQYVHEVLKSAPEKA